MNLEQALLRDTRANQPLATLAGTGALFCVTDEDNIVEQSDGSAWNPYSPTSGSGGISALTGDVTATGPGSVAATIADDAVTNAKLRESAALSVIGRSANSTGNPADIAATPASAAVLRESGSTIGFGTIATAGITDAAVTYAKIQDVSAADRLLGRGQGGGAGDVQEISLGSGLALTGTVLDATGSGGITQLTGDVTAGPGSGSVAATIASDAVTTAKILDANVTYAKIQDVSAISKLLGRGAGAGAGDVEEITLGTGLSMSGTTLNSSGGAQRAVFCFCAGVAAGHDPADNSTYVWGLQAFTNPNVSGIATVFGAIQPRNGTVTRAYGTFVVSGVLCTAGQTSTVRVRNSTASTSEVITSSLQMNAIVNNFNNTAMTLAFSAGDQLEISLLTPGWTTNPTDVFYNVTVEVEYS